MPGRGVVSLPCAGFDKKVAVTHANKAQAAIFFIVNGPAVEGGGQAAGGGAVVHQRVLHEVDVLHGKRGFAVGEVELPDVHEALVKAQLQDLCALRQKALAPALEGFGVVLPKGELVHHAQARGFGLAAEFARAGQAAAGEDVLLDEIGELM